jgi:hypothetical protein
MRIGYNIVIPAIMAEHEAARPGTEIEIPMIGPARVEDETG